MLGKKGIGCISILSLAALLFAGVAADPMNNTEAGIVKKNSTVAGVVAEIEMPQASTEARVMPVQITMVAQTNEEAIEETVTEEAQITTEEKEEESYWDKHLIVDVKDNLNVRSRASQKSKLVGLMFPKNGAKILKTKGNWYKIESGNLKGYVKASYCLTGKKAEHFAQKNGCYRATALSGGLRIRSAASTDGKIYTVVDKGSSLATAKKACKKEGWVAVIYKGKRAFVSSDYVKVSLRTSKGLTMKEYREKLAKEAAAKKAAEAAARAAETTRAAGRRTTETTTTSRQSVAADVDDVTLLAALIHCEAGNQPYAGKLAVGAVVCNRIRSGRFPNTLRGVVYQRGQFGPAGSGLLARRLGSGQISSSCYRAAREALAGADNVGGALFFRSVRSGYQGLVISGHVFF